MLKDAWRGTPRGFQWINRHFYNNKLTWDAIPEAHWMAKLNTLQSAGIMRDSSSQRPQKKGRLYKRVSSPSEIIDITSDSEEEAEANSVPPPIPDKGAKL